MRREPVSFEALLSVGYDADQRILEVEFAGGAIYRYFDVPHELHLGLMTSPSKGEFFATHLRDTGFEYVRVG